MHPRRKFLSALVVLTISGTAAASELADFEKACTGSSNLTPEICTCAGKKAQAELSPKGFDFLVATLANDTATTDKLRPELPMAEAMKSATFMLRGPAACAAANAPKEDSAAE